MRKWMRERLQRRKKKSPEQESQPAPPPLQPAYFEAGEAPELAHDEAEAPEVPWLRQKFKAKNRRLLPNHQNPPPRLLMAQARAQHAAGDAGGDEVEADEGASRLWRSRLRQPLQKVHCPRDLRKRHRSNRGRGTSPGTERARSSGHNSRRDTAPSQGHRGAGDRTARIG